MRHFRIDAKSIEIDHGVNKIILRIYAEPKDLLEDVSVDEIVENTDVDNLLKRIGKDAAAAYWNLTDAEV